MKKILLIGKTGQLGRAISEDAADFGFEIVTFARKDLDATNSAQIEEKLNEVHPDILMNTSAYHVVSKCEDYPDDAMRANFVAVGDMAKLCKARNIQFVTYSTSYVFDGEKGTSYEEYDRPNPLQAYGISKVAGEYAALNFYPEGAFVIRTGGLYGGGKEGSPSKGGNFVLNIIKEAEESDADTIEVGSEQSINPAYSKDLSRATLQLLSTNTTPGLYHIANTGYCNWAEFSEEVFKLAGINKKVKAVNRGGFDKKGTRKPTFAVLSLDKIKKLGINPPTWQSGLTRYIKSL
jgi:dTDP-4-dehydrorhamnose reductase